MATKPPSPPVPPPPRPSGPPTRDANIGTHDYGERQRHNVDPIYQVPAAPPPPPKK